MTDPTHAFALPPPHSIPAEQAILGWLLGNPEEFDDIAATLDMADLYLPAHRTVYGTMLELRAANKPTDSILVLEALKAAGRMDLAGGEDGLHALAVAGMLDADIPECVKIVRDKSTARSVIESARRLMDRAYDQSATGPELVESMRASATTLERGTTNDLINVRDILDDVFRDIDSPAASPGIRTGLVAVDDKIQTGFEPGQLILVGGRPGMGKSALGVNFAMRMIADGVAVGFLSFEMSNTQVLRRLLAATAKVNIKHLSNGRFITDAERCALTDAIETVRNCAPLLMDDGSGPTTAVLRSKARSMVERQGCRILFVDHLGLIRPSVNDRTIRSTVDVVSHVSRELKALAKDLKVPIVAMCQLNREAAKGNKSTKREDIQPPTLTDLRDSGSLEQDADIVMLLHRPGYYTGSDPAEAQVIIAKQRDGETGTANLAWAGWCQRFADVAP